MVLETNLKIIKKIRISIHTCGRKYSHSADYFPCKLGENESFEVRGIITCIDRVVGRGLVPGPAPR